MAFDSPAQDKVLTMEDAVLGRHLYPQNKNLIWRGAQNTVTYTEDKSLYEVDPSQKTPREVMSLDKLNTLLGASLEEWPSYSWHDAHTLLVQHEGKLVTLDLDEQRLLHTRTFRDDAANFAMNREKSLMAYTVGNNLHYADLNNNDFAITRDEDTNFVSGQTVSRNEFGIDRGIFWAPDGKRVAFYRKDESQVGTFPLLDINTRTGSLREIKYPMAGMKSEQVSLGVYDIASQQTVFMEVDDFGREQYLTNIAWSPASDYIYIQVLDRAQKHMHLNKYDARTGKFVKTLLKEENDKYFEPQTPIVFLKNDPTRFIYRSNNIDGYYSLYLVNEADGRILKRLTPTPADVAYVGQDDRSVYYTSAEVSPVENHLFKVDIKSGKKTRLTFDEGWHNITLSDDAQYFLDNYSSVEVPRVINLVRNDGKIMKEMFRAENPTADYNYGKITLGTVKSADGNYDNYYRLIQPMNFDPQKKYPTIVYVYGGPHSQLVKNTWQAELRRWEMYMAQQGYVVFVMDNRGTLNRGQAFEQAIHRQCGQAEMADQMEGVKFLRSLPYVDAERIGVHGWSYGGFMTISLITNYPDVFKVAVAGGPVIDWKWYEVMYGERYMDSPHTNAEGYEKVSLIHKAKDLKGKLLICQGAIDNTVVWEHSLSFIRECIKNNVQVDYFPYPCAEHNVFGRDRIHLMQKVTDYFEDYLR